MSDKRPSSPQLSVRTPAAESIGRVESVTIGEVIKRSFTSFLCIFFSFCALTVSNINFISIVYMIHKPI